jgi:hypothetical protein
MEFASCVYERHGSDYLNNQCRSLKTYISSVRYYFVVVVLLFLTEYSFSQPPIVKDYFQSPLDIQLSLSGNFGEFRNDHFHSGIDIRTQGVSGKKVYAAADGYISRIKVETGGYGNSIYITHPGGYTTVYGHLDRYIPAIEQYVRKRQYQERKHALNIFPSKNEIQVKKGELIAYSGNTGYSFGPHLHFEIRSTANQYPMNVLLFGLNIDDNVPPRIFSVCIYPLDEKSFINHSNGKLIIPVHGENGSYSINSEQIPRLTGQFGFGIEAYDYLNGSRSRCGLYTVELFVDTILYYSWKMGEFSFSESKYINSLIDYQEKVENNINIHKTYIDPNNHLNLYEYHKNNGIVEFVDDEEHTIRFMLHDAYLNKAQLDFQVQGQSVNLVSNRHHEDDFLQFMSWETMNTFEREDIKLIIPEKALYKDLKFTYSKSEIPDGLFSMVHHIHNIYTPLHLPADLYLKPDNLPDSLKDKSIVVIADQDGNWQSAGGEWDNGFVKTKISQFGSYSVSIDTTAPMITPLNLTGSNNMSDKSSIQFRINDALSGIQSYEGYIDNEWALFEYDAKNNLVFYKFDPDRIDQNQNHELELYIVDNKDNISFYYTEFYW